jgi:hypothetical protein
MTPPPTIIIFLLLLTLFACGQSGNKPESYNENRKLVPDPEGYKKDTIISSQTESTKNIKCDFDKFLNDPETPKFAKELYYNTYKLRADEPLDLLEKLESKDFPTRQFYFRVITNSYNISDGAYSEGLGNIGKEYIENKTLEFTQYFDDKDCFNDKDLETWAGIAILEFSIIGEGEYDKPIIDKFNNKLESNCVDCSVSQKETIRKFAKILKVKWLDYLKNIDN